MTVLPSRIRVALGILQRVRDTFSWQHMTYQLELLSVSISHGHQYNVYLTLFETASAVARYFRMAALT